MDKSKKSAHRDDTTRSNHVDLATIGLLINDLGSKDGMVRVKARHSLVDIGAPSVGLLVEALASKKQWTRWEAAKALGQIGNPTAAEALVEALEDKVFDVRWLAAEGLIAIGHDAVVPLLRALTKQSDSLYLREGAHHVLHDMDKGKLKEVLRPVLAALEDVEPSVEVPLAAETALENRW